MCWTVSWSLAERGGFDSLTLQSVPQLTDYRLPRAPKAPRSPCTIARYCTLAPDASRVAAPARRLFAELAVLVLNVNVSATGQFFRARHGFRFGIEHAARALGMGLLYHPFVAARRNKNFFMLMVGHKTILADFVRARNRGFGGSPATAAVEV